MFTPMLNSTIIKQSECAACGYFFQSTNYQHRLKKFQLHSLMIITLETKKKPRVQLLKFSNKIQMSVNRIIVIKLTHKFGIE